MPSTRSDSRRRTASRLPTMPVWFCFGGRIAPPVAATRCVAIQLDILVTGGWGRHRDEVDKEGERQLMSSWKNPRTVDSYVQDVRASVPFLAEHVAILHRLLGDTFDELGAIIDLGCGDGALAESVLHHYPNAKAILIDHSAPMLALACERFASLRFQTRTLNRDLGTSEWIGELAEAGEVDLVVSGFAIHHLTDERKQELFAEILEILRPGGMFVNLEHVASNTPAGRRMFDEVFIDQLCQTARTRGEVIDRATVAERYHSREDQHDNILVPADDQCAWLRDTGYVEVDCYVRYLEIALFAGRKPS